MGLDCRQYLDAKQYEFLLNWFIRAQRQHQLASLAEPLSYDGHSAYDLLASQLMTQARLAYTERFGEPPVPLALTNLFHLAELEIAGKRNPKGFKTPPQRM